MRILKRILKYIFRILLVPILYLLVSLVLTAITVNDYKELKQSHTIFLNTNGVHLDIILPVNMVNEELLRDLNVSIYSYLSFGWGDENFYLNTPNWSDLTFKNAFGAMFLNSSTLIHLTRYESKDDDWVKVKLTDNQLRSLNQYILKTFSRSSDNSKIILKDQGYSFNDDFYKSNVSYSCFNTCNTWVNSAFKTSGLKSCYWTPFDFGLINKYKN